MQLRTMLQDAWANQVEKDSRQMGVGFKFGKSEEVVHDYHRVVPDAFAALDREEDLSQEQSLLSMRVTHAFETLGLEHVVFRTDILRERSQRAIERLGATREGVHRHEMCRRDCSWRDSVRCSILREELPAARVALGERLAAIEAR